MEPRFTSFLANRGSVVSGLRYSTPGAGDAAKAGLMDASGHLPADVPSNWQIYFAVEDADATIEKAVSLGAAVIDGPDDSPFGRFATLADPPAPCSRSSRTLCSPRRPETISLTAPS